MKKENSKNSFIEKMGEQSGIPRKPRRTKRMINALHRANHKCEMCGAGDNSYTPLEAYHLDGADKSWKADLTVVLCPGCAKSTRRAWPPGAGWINGTPDWAFRRGIFRAVLDFANLRGPDGRGRNQKHKTQTKPRTAA